MMKKDLYNFDEHSTELLGAYQLMEKWTKGAPLSDADKAAIRADPKKREALANQLVTDAVAAIKTMPNVPDKVKNKDLTSGELDNVKKWATELSNDLELKGSRAKYDNLGGFQQGEVKIIDQVGAASAAPGARCNGIAPALFTLIQGAQKEIVIQNPYVVLTEPMMKAFEEASARGVKITIVTNSPESTDSAVTQGFFLNDWKKLEERVPSARVFVATGERKFHAKAFVADGKVSGDTSYNADLLSGMVNGEVGAITRSEDVAQNLMNHIYDDLHDPANKFREWTIQRDPSGKAVHGADGQPIAIEGPEQDVSQKLQKRYKVVQFLCDAITRLELGSPLAHPG
jgi:phosphatidylserine/phosphatidylglycerophosphate/cardiolipin synthase-like enzyme